MKITNYIITIALVISGINLTYAKSKNQQETVAYDVLTRSAGSHIANKFELTLVKEKKQQDSYTTSVKNNKVLIEATSVTGLTRAAYSYLKKEQNSLMTWSGKKFNISKKLQDYNESKTSPYTYRYYLNVVTHGYTTAYWDWDRWEQELDWMAMHGLNMPLLGGAHEAILYRVFRKLGFTKEQSYEYFTGPAHFPWNRMGNIAGWDGAKTLPDTYFEKQIALNHKILKRIKELEMTPIIHAFAGFMPPATTELFPEEKIRKLDWAGGLPKKTNSFLLAPNSPLFVKIGKLYIEEWEKEFGKNEFYLADSFNEMDVPKTDSENTLLKELARYGKQVYQSITAANPEATWVMQGWTFPYHKDASGELFWTPSRLGALVSEVPGDKLLLLDLANEYNRLLWDIEPSWKIYSGFWDKQWVYSFIPNMGGKTPINGRLDLYASMPFEALNYKHKGKLVGYGFAPEGIENNEMIYELLADIAWEREAFDVVSWQQNYAEQRYGMTTPELLNSLDLLNSSALGDFTDHPIFRFQLRPNKPARSFSKKATVHKSHQFELAVQTFLGSSEKLKESQLYTYDAIELTSIYLGLVADEYLNKFLITEAKNRNYLLLDEAFKIMEIIDRLLASHPTHRLEPWVEFARNWGDTDSEKNYYESNAKRLLTTWGGQPVNDYAGRMWSGLIESYYKQRWEKNHMAKKANIAFSVDDWEEEWLKTPYINHSIEYNDPLQEAISAFNKYKGQLQY